MSMQAISHEDKETNTKVYITEIQYYNQAISSNQDFSISPYSDGGHTAGEQPDSNLPDPSSQVLAPIYAEIADDESTDPTYASVGVATGKYTYNITANSSYDTVMLQSMNPNTCYDIAT